MTQAEAREQLASFGHSLFERGLSFGSAGNLSVRLPDGWLMTPTNVSLGRLDPARLSRLDDKGRHVEGDAPIYPAAGAAVPERADRMDDAQPHGDAAVIGPKGESQPAGLRLASPQRCRIRSAVEP